MSPRHIARDKHPDQMTDSGSDNWQHCFVSFSKKLGFSLSCNFAPENLGKVRQTHASGIAALNWKVLGKTIFSGGLTAKRKASAIPFKLSQIAGKINFSFHSLSFYIHLLHELSVLAVLALASGNETAFITKLVKPTNHK